MHCLGQTIQFRKQNEEALFELAEVGTLTVVSEEQLNQGHVKKVKDFKNQSKNK